MDHSAVLENAVVCHYSEDLFIKMYQTCSHGQRNEMCTGYIDSLDIVAISHYSQLQYKDVLIKSYQICSHGQRNEICTGCIDIMDIVILYMIILII